MVHGRFYVETNNYFTSVHVNNPVSQFTYKCLKLAIVTDIWHRSKSVLAEWTYRKWEHVWQSPWWVRWQGCDTAAGAARWSGAPPPAHVQQTPVYPLLTLHSHTDTVHCCCYLTSKHDHFRKQHRLTVVTRHCHLATTDGSCTTETSAIPQINVKTNRTKIRALLTTRLVETPNTGAGEWCLAECGDVICSTGAALSRRCGELRTHSLWRVGNADSNVKDKPGFILTESALTANCVLCLCF